jgi:hypothetical protein
MSNIPDVFYLDTTSLQRFQRPRRSKRLNKEAIEEVIMIIKLS